MNLLILFLLASYAVIPVNAEISSSSDLNCDFTSTCRWRNSSDVGGHFETTSLLEADAQNRIMPIDENYPKPFAYTAGLMGRMMALLVSEVITCQLGGASIKYWYYKTGLDSQLEVCIRQPPGNRDLSQMRCYDGVSTFGKQWIFRAVELPPIAQPFEIVFKTIYSPPSSVIALDNIVFEATLCGYGRNRREIRRIGYHDWQSYRSSNLYNGELMLIVAQDVADKLSSSTAFTTTTAEPIGLEAKISILSSTTTSTTTTTTGEPSTTTTVFTIPTTTTSESIASSTTASTTTSTISSSSPTPSTNKNSTLSNEQQLANFINFLKQTAPVIPYIPTLVRSLTALDPRNSEELLPSGLGQSPPPVSPVDVRRSPVISSHFYNTNQPTLVTDNNPDNQRALVDLAKKFGLWEDKSPTVTTIPTPVRNTELTNTFGLPNKLTEASIYPPNLLQNKKKITMNPIKKIPQPVASVENIEEYHKNLFKVSTTTPSSLIASSTELIIFKQPSSGEVEVAEKLADIAKLLPSGAVHDLTALRNIPDLDGLTKGMDLSDIRKPGGFGRLKTQFMERLMRRTLGLPMETDDVKLLPPPIVPMKVTRKMMAEMMKRKAARRRMN